MSKKKMVKQYPVPEIGAIPICTYNGSSTVLILNP